MSESLRTWGLRLLALGIALGLWFNSSFEDREVQSERMVEASVNYSWPQGYVVLNPEQSIDVRVRGNGKQILGLRDDQVDVQVELGRQEGELTINLGTENVLLPEGLEVISIDPNIITVEVERAVSRRIRVVPDLVGQPVPGARVEEPDVFPSQALVTGPASLVASTEVLGTRPVNLTGRSTTFEERVPVLTPDPLIRIVDPTRVTVRVSIQPPRNEAPPAQTEER